MPHGEDLSCGRLSPPGRRPVGDERGLIGTCGCYELHDATQPHIGTIAPRQDRRLLVGLIESALDQQSDSRHESKIGRQAGAVAPGRAVDPDNLGRSCVPYRSSSASRPARRRHWQADWPPSPLPSTRWRPRHAPVRVPASPTPRRAPAGSASAAEWRCGAWRAPWWPTPRGRALPTRPAGPR